MGPLRFPLRGGPFNNNEVIIVTREEFGELLSTAKRLADTGEQIVKVLAAHAREEKDPQAHQTFVRMLNTTRDCSAALNFVLRDAPSERR